ncbi:uncharacterized protein LOC108899902 [Lates calcarifer]|uniref:Uncharacterized protein LOC108899902 n=1 Tax=Lates calcarifer TaxID=8187 RepID=A0AAJ7QHF6_LATCA|nr:uncharacterized protein LOC108899902 [Lates calcarifer]
MDGVLEGATVLCVCKLACSLLFLPALTASHSPVSFCCCCLLIFTDFLVAVFLSFLCIFESWLTELTLLGDVIALRFLLFLSHTYGTVLLLTTPLIAVETLTRLLWPHSVVSYKAVGRPVDSDGQHCYIREVTVEEEEDDDNPDEDKDKGVSHAVGYLCCLSVWVVVALNVRLAMEAGGRVGFCLRAHNRFPHQMFAQPVQPHAQHCESLLGHGFPLLSPAPPDHEHRPEQATPGPPTRGGDAPGETWS